MTDLSPMERAVRALASRLASHLPGVVPVSTGRVVVDRLADLRTSDPEAFAAVLAECGLDRLSPNWNPWAQGRCPACGSSGTLFIASGGYLTCSLDRCANPTAAADLLANPEGQAVIEGRVVELEAKRRHASGCVPEWGDCGCNPVIYRIKPERSDQHTEDVS